ncbi:unnamed protein product [Ostreobium quekettii]|uniref:Radical SAM core domain-containing protein n=1 Tax=Ostreobium quekettii TaxID=121088 RepID=A0A8S1IWI8_9CHLO|nr:unnamed protein product [Ostreobium quekettii]
MHYDTTGRSGGRGHRRATVCISSQIGCKMGCKFCATGTMGLKGNLTAAEIIEQLVHARAVVDFRNVVFMGMGEPLNNYDAVKTAVQVLTDTKLFGISRQHVTISTVGVIGKIRQMAVDLKGVSLAFSLHAATQDVRERIVPSARAYKLDKLMEALDDYMAATEQRVFVEYVMLAHINDSRQEADAVGSLLHGRNVVLNLIPFNPTYAGEGIKFEAPPAETVLAFQEIVRSVYGVPCTVRQTKGPDISGACGQLVVQTSMATGCSSHTAIVDVEELADGMR